jgi:predicted transglutaminase-like cysteine proteinase
MTFDDLRTVNSDVNQYPYESEVGDDWSPIGEAKGGDCDSYATEKMQRLVKMGWPEKSLRLACCFVERTAGPKPNRYHLVLLADLDSTTYVLDNRHFYPMEHDLVDYEWHRFWCHDLNTWEWAKNADRSF